jgi:4-hydroxy-tetrahydrodipicolinate synthase
MPVAFKPEGVWTALATPFDKKGKVDSAAFKHLIDFQISQGISGLVPAGTTGESPSLSWDEHHQVIEESVAFAKDRVGILAGTGSNCTDEAIDATRHAQESGASGALLVDCYYNGPSSLELRVEYYEAVAEWTNDLPLVPYVIPGRTGTALSAEDLALLHRSQPKRFPAVKEATGDTQRMKQDRALCGESLAILSGDDDLTLSLIADPGIQASGAISVMSNLAPAALQKMVQAARSGDKDTAAKLAAQMEGLFKLVGCKVPGSRKLPNGQTVVVEDRFRNPVPIKTMMAGLGLPVGLCRKPLGKMTKAGVARCRQTLLDLHKKAPEILSPIGQAFGVDVERRLRDDSVWAELTRAE